MHLILEQYSLQCGIFFRILNKKIDSPFAFIYRNASSSIQYFNFLLVFFFKLFIFTSFNSNIETLVKAAKNQSADMSQNNEYVDRSEVSENFRKIMDVFKISPAEMASLGLWALENAQMKETSDWAEMFPNWARVCGNTEIFNLGFTLLQKTFREHHLTPKHVTSAAKFAQEQLYWKKWREANDD